MVVSASGAGIDAGNLQVTAFAFSNIDQAGAGTLAGYVIGDAQNRMLFVRAATTDPGVTALQAEFGTTPIPLANSRQAGGLLTALFHLPEAAIGARRMTRPYQGWQVCSGGESLY